MSYPTTGIATLDDLRTVTGMGDTAMRNAIKRGELPAKKVGGIYLIRWEWITAWIEGRPGFWDLAATDVPGKPQPRIDFIHPKQKAKAS